MTVSEDMIEIANTCVGITRSTHESPQIRMYKNGVPMNLTEDAIRQAVETFLGETASNLYVAWSMGIPRAISVCAHENLTRPKPTKSQKEALEIIRQAAINLDTKGTYHGN